KKKNMADHTGLVAELKRWCRGEGLEEAKALLVLVPEEVEMAQIEETLETIKCLGTPYQNRMPLGEQFCYRCGENGHFVAMCQNPENQSKVIRKLIQTVKTLKESAGTSTSNATDTD
uniref:CCHC-type domain-containing protein n=1 Tax=Oreochromis niloticus TaxID=8128 RepID=A0A669DIV0_ORENI